MSRKRYLVIVDAGCGILVPLQSAPGPDPVRETGPETVMAPQSLIDALEEPYRILLWLDAGPAEESA